MAFFRYCAQMIYQWKEKGSFSDLEKFQEARDKMVKEQLEAPEQGIRDPRVLEAFRKVPRHEWVPKKWRAFAYEDRPLPIGKGQTISQPFIVGFMTEQLGVGSTSRVLEVGTGSGYQAAILSCLVQEVYSVERIKSLAYKTARKLRSAGYENVQVRWGDGYEGWLEAAPFDAIIVTCAREEVPPPLVEQLKEGGRLIFPKGRLEAGQKLYLLEKKKQGVVSTELLKVRFVPFV